MQYLSALVLLSTAALSVAADGYCCCTRKTNVQIDESIRGYRYDVTSSSAYDCGINEAGTCAIEYVFRWNESFTASTLEEYDSTVTNNAQQDNCGVPTDGGRYYLNENYTSAELGFLLTEHIHNLSVGCVGPQFIFIFHQLEQLFAARQLSKLNNK